MTILRTGETWKAHPTVAGLYLEQLSYFVFLPIGGERAQLPDSFKDLASKVVVAPESLRVKSFGGFSLLTGRFKIIGSDTPLLFAE